jgi:hypothetical protein
MYMYMSMYHVKWAPCHHGMAHALVEDGEAVANSRQAVAVQLGGLA